MPEQKPVANLDEDAFMKEALSDISSADLEASEVPAKITKFTRKKSEAKGKEGKKARPLDVKVNRFKHKDMLGEKDVEGSCGRPICALIDSRPKRFASLCNFTLFLKENHLSRQLFHIQKGDCADASELPQTGYFSHAAGHIAEFTPSFS